MNIQNAIKQLALAGSEMYLAVCTVDAVHEKERTVDCTPIDEGAQLLGVNLQADQSGEVGLVSFPAVGSDVVVGFINPAVAVVILTTELTKSILTLGNSSVTLTSGNLKLDIDGTSLELGKGLSFWNGGSETTANASELQTQLNKCKTRIDAIINALLSAPTGKQDGGLMYKEAVASALSGLVAEDYSNIIDDKIKH